MLDCKTVGCIVIEHSIYIYMVLVLSVSSLLSYSIFLKADQQNRGIMYTILVLEGNMLSSEVLKSVEPATLVDGLLTQQTSGNSPSTNGGSGDLTKGMSSKILSFQFHS